MNGDFEYEIEDDSAVLYGGNFTKRSKLTIPEHLGGYPVTKIGEGAFSNKGIEKVYFPEGLIFIGERAFSGNELKQVTLPDSIRIIDSFAFERNNLNEINIPKNVKLVTANSFTLNNLEKITVNKENTFYMDVEQSCLCTKDGESLVLGTSMGFIPETIKQIFPEAFHSMMLPRAIAIPEGVEYIGEAAFANSGIYEVQLPSTLKTIKRYAFVRNHLKDVYLPEKIDFLGNASFADNEIKYIFLTSKNVSFEPNPLLRSGDRADITLFIDGDATNGSFLMNDFITTIYISQNNQIEELEIKLKESNKAWDIVGEDELRKIYNMKRMFAA